MLLYNGTIDIQFNEGSHRYKVNGTYVEGVTSMLKILDKPGLLQWGANMVCDYIKLNCNKDAEFNCYLVTDEALAIAKYAHATKRDNAADIGKQVHKWVEEHIRGSETPITKEMRPGIDVYLRWEQQVNPLYLSSERVCYSKQYGYCGTTDALVMLNGKRTVLDFKTGKPEEEYNPRTKHYTGRKRARAEHFIQDAFYDIAISEEDSIAADQYAVLYITDLDKDKPDRPIEKHRGEAYLYTTQQVEVYKQMAKHVLNTCRTKKLIEKLNGWEKDNG